jgi:NAD(P)-dependent dehydrogenase (short-subunit alcohol dehydrogenase family)
VATLLPCPISWTCLGPLKELPTKVWDASFDLYVRAAYVATREAGLHFIEQGSGAIVNISSGALLPAPVSFDHFGTAEKSYCTWYVTVQGQTFKSVNGGKDLCGNVPSNL